VVAREDDAAHQHLLHLFQSHVQFTPATAQGEIPGYGIGDVMQPLELSAVLVRVGQADEFEAGISRVDVVGDIVQFAASISVNVQGHGTVGFEVDDVEPVFWV